MNVVGVGVGASTERLKHIDTTIHCCRANIDEQVYMRGRMLLLLLSVCLVFHEGACLLDPSIHSFIQKVNSCYVCHAHCRLDTSPIGSPPRGTIIRGDTPVHKSVHARRRLLGPKVPQHSSLDIHTGSVIAAGRGRCCCCRSA